MQGLRRVLLLWVCTFGMLQAAAPPSRTLPDSQGPWVVRAYFTDKVQLNRLTQRTAPWEVRHDQRFAVVEVANRYEYSLLIAEGFRVSIDDALTQVLRQPQRGFRSVPGYGCYRTVEETFASMDALVSAQPTLASVIDIGDSWNKINHPGTGYDLRVLRLTNSAISGPKPRVFIMGAIHAREYTTAETVMRFAEDLIGRYANDADVRWMLDHQELYLLPHANPDGRKKAELGQLWRKNLNENYCGATSNARGADLNRNFPFEWGAHGGSSGTPCDDIYRGASPASEPETAAVVAYLRSLFPDVRPPDLVTPAPADGPGVFLDVHSYGRLVMWPWSFTATLPPNPTMATLGRRLAWFNGYVPQQGIDLYVTDGGTKDFVYGDLGLPGMSFEIGSAFFEACADFESQELTNNFKALLYLLRTARHPYQEPSGPSLDQLLSAPVEPGETIRIVGSASDSAFNQSHGSEPTQNVSEVAAYLNQLPWAPSAIADASATALDGSFNASDESWLAELPSNGLPVGRHTVYLRSSDSGGHGPTYARFVDVVAVGSTARLQGVVRNANTGAPLAVPAMVRLGDLGSASQPSGGSSYALRAPTGSYTLTATANGYAAAVLNGISLSAPATLTQDISLAPFCGLFSDSASGDLGNFIAQSPWGIGNVRYYSAPAAFTDSPTGDYAANANTALTLNPLDLHDVANVRLKFQSYCDTEAGFDFGHVETSTDGSNWTEVWRCDANASWVAVDLTLPALNNQANARIRFRFTSDSGVQLDGWSVDDIVIDGTGPVCGGVPDALFTNGFE